MSLEIRLQHAIADRRLMTYRPEEILPAVNQILFQTYVLLGFSPPNDRDLGILIAKLAADLQESYPSLTLQEVALCFELGAKGEYGDFMGLNLRTITRWLKCYQTSDLRYRAVVEREQAKSLSALPPVSEAYKEEHSCAGCLSNTGRVVRSSGFIRRGCISPCKHGELSATVRRRNGLPCGKRPVTGLPGIWS